MKSTQSSIVTTRKSQHRTFSGQVIRILLGFDHRLAKVALSLALSLDQKKSWASMIQMFLGTLSQMDSQPLRHLLPSTQVPGALRSLTLCSQPAHHSGQSLCHKCSIHARPRARRQRGGVGGDPMSSSSGNGQQSGAIWRLRHDRDHAWTELSRGWAWEGRTEPAQAENNRNGRESCPGRHLGGRNDRIYWGGRCRREKNQQWLKYQTLGTRRKTGGSEEDCLSGLVWVGWL